MTTEHFLVLSALGPDRAGLVAEITAYLADRGVNIEDSRMAILGAEFGVMMLVSGNSEQLVAVTRDLSSLEAATGLGMLTRPTRSPTEYRRSAVLPAVITAEALDQEGIVRSVAAALHGLGINIVSLHTTAYNAPITGSELFRLEARVDVPRGLTLAALRAAMEDLARKENIDVEVRAATGAL